MLKIPEYNSIVEHYQREAMRHLTTDLWLETFCNYKVEDTRPWWRKIYDRAHWKTIGRFRAWLHRDCGDY